MARYIVFGAGAVGGLIGARLHLAGHDVVLIARGAHRETLSKRGLLFKTATTSETIALPVVASASDILIAADDTVILAMKTQDAVLTLEDLAAAAPRGAAIVCAQNGIESERSALRLFENVYGAYLYVFAGQIEPGVVTCHSAPCHGVIDVGRYPAGADERAAVIAADLEGAGFSSLVRDNIMTWKRGKLVLNTANAVNSVCANAAMAQDIVDAAQDEARRCFEAAGLDFASIEAIADRGKSLTATTVDGRHFPGSSTFQSLIRGNPTTEADYLNGQIALLGREIGIATPVNASLQDLLRRAARDRVEPGSMSAEELRRLTGLTG